ncbi:MAG: hypothetical protein QE263_05110 [Vampirovibrionales bacterium]|nr:hypothetical protein [Vampirovibrionales bacterium]
MPSTVLSAAITATLPRWVELARQLQQYPLINKGIIESTAVDIPTIGLARNAALVSGLVVVNNRRTIRRVQQDALEQRVKAHWLPLSKQAHLQGSRQ